jgi:hypothetical protein
MLAERRAAFAPAGRLHPVPDDVLVTEVTADGVPAHWLAAPGPCWMRSPRSRPRPAGR